MINFRAMFETESTRGIILFLSARERVISYPELDLLFTQFKFDVVASRELFITFENMKKEGVIESYGKMAFRRGPKWIEPDFMSEGKYIID